MLFHLVLARCRLLSLEHEGRGDTPPPGRQTGAIEATLHLIADVVVAVSAAFGGGAYFSSLLVRPKLRSFCRHER